jgi:hypothetical protein
MPDTDQEELFVDIPDSGQSIDVEIEPLELSPDDPGFGTENPDEEHLEYSKKVKRRIDKLTKKAREMERQQAAAVDYARNIQAENNQLRTRVQDLDQGYVAEYGDRIATQSDSLSRDLETAIATNDTSAQVALNKKLYQLAIEEERVRSAKQQQAQQQSAAASAAAVSAAAVSAAGSATAATGPCPGRPQGADVGPAQQLVRGRRRNDVRGVWYTQDSGRRRRL